VLNVLEGGGCIEVEIHLEPQHMAGQEGHLFVCTQAAMKIIMVQSLPWYLTLYISTDLFLSFLMFLVTVAEIFLFSS
jgi:hypothetical protein